MLKVKYKEIKILNTLDNNESINEVYAVYLDKNIIYNIN